MLTDLEILFGLALVTVILFRRFRFSSIVGFLVTGVIAGPHALGFIDQAHQVEQIAEIGVVLLLFTIGLEFSLKELMKIKHLVFLGGGLQVGVTILTVTGISLLFAFPFKQSVFFGFLIALSSTAVLIKLLMDKGEMDSPRGRVCLGILIFQDLCIVPLMLLTPFLAGKGGGIVDLFIVCAKAAGVVLVAHYAARFIVPWIFSQVVKTKSKELFILTVLFIGLGMAWLTAKVGLSLALGAFIAGLAIAESEYSHKVLGDIIPFRDAFMGLFFISVGMLLDPAIILKHPVIILLLILGIIIVKSGVTVLAMSALGLTIHLAISSGFALSQIGEFSFILAQTGMQEKLLTPEIYQIFLAASIASMGLTPLCLRVGPYIGRFVPDSFKRMRGLFVNDEQAPPMSDHVIIVGYGVNGQNLARILKNLSIPYMVIDTNPFTVRGERKKGENIIFGDAAQESSLEHLQIASARILVVAISDTSASLRVASMARHLNPSIHIIVRARYFLEVEPLVKMGVNEVIPEEFETSVEILIRVLRALMIPHDDIETCVTDIRKDGYEMLRSISKRHSHAVGISGYLSGAEIANFRIQEGSPLVGEGLSKGTIRQQSGATVLVIKRGDDVIPNPDPVWEFSAGDILLLLGSPKQLAVAGRFFEAGK
ncbi:MAG: cation:proton antiporter [Desulfuromonadales bacterium]|nr:cation:proton antiporter [Desulfuromonadales bacterium]